MDGTSLPVPRAVPPADLEVMRLALSEERSLRLLSESSLEDALAEVCAMSLFLLPFLYAALSVTSVDVCARRFVRAQRRFSCASSNLLLERFQQTHLVRTHGYNNSNTAVH